MGDNENFCPNCGQPVSTTKTETFLDNPTSTNVVGLILGIVSGFTYPIVGVLLGGVFYFVWKENHPAASNGSKKCAIVSAVIWILMFVLALLFIAAGISLSIPIV